MMAVVCVVRVLAGAEDELELGRGCWRLLESRERTEERAGGSGEKYGASC